MTRKKIKLPPIEVLDKIDAKQKWRLGMLIVDGFGKHLIQKSEAHSGKKYKGRTRDALMLRMYRGSDAIDSGLEEALKKSAEKGGIKFTAYQHVPLALQPSIDWSNPEMHFATSSHGRPVEVVIHFLRADH